MSDSTDINFEVLAFEAFREYLRKLEGFTENPLEVPEEAESMFCSGYWKGWDAAIAHIKSQYTLCEKEPSNSEIYHGKKVLFYREAK